MQKYNLSIMILAFMLISCQHSSNKINARRNDLRHQNIDSLNIQNQALYQILDTITTDKHQALIHNYPIFYVGICNNIMQIGCSTIKYFQLSLNYTHYKGYFKYNGYWFLIDSIYTPWFAKTHKQHSFFYTHYKLPPPPDPSEAHSIGELKIIRNAIEPATAD